VAVKSGWLIYICCGLIATTVSGCVTMALPPAMTSDKVIATAPLQDPADQLLAAAQEHAGKAPPPFKLVELPSTQGIDPGQNSQLKPGPATTEFWVARGDLGRYGGTLTASTFGSGPKTFCYWASDDAESGGMGELINECLIDLDPWTGKFYPRLARSFTVSPDKKEYTFVLRKGLQWSDGAPLNADDVVFTLNKIIKDGYGNPSIRDTLSVDGEFPDVEKVDDLTVRVRTKKPFAPFLNGLRGMPIAPKHAMEAICNKDRALFTGFWDINCDPTKIVVSGPFKIERYVPGQRLELVRNPYYAFVDRDGRRLPYLDRFVLAIVPDQNTELLKFYAGEIDILDKGSLRGSDAAQMKQRERSGNFTMYNLGADEGTVFLMFNMNRRRDPKTGKSYLDPIKQKWFNNLFFRQAVAHAINRRRLVDNILRGVGLPLYGPEAPGSLYCNKSLQHYPQDMKLAADLLKQGGFVLREGKLFDSDGHRVEFTLQTNAGNSSREGCCVMIANDLADLGTKVNFQPIDFNIMIDKTSTSCDWEAILMALTGDKIEPYSGANIWKSNGRLHMFDQRQVGKDGFVHVFDARDWEKEIDKLFDEGGTTLDITKRHQIFDRYQQIVYDELPYIYLYSTLDLTAMNNRIGNYNPTPLGILYLPKGSLHNIEEIYVKQKNH
jgi:peptide/nickel transport system substrate-binding protein